MRRKRQLLVKMTVCLVAGMTVAACGKEAKTETEGTAANPADAYVGGPVEVTAYLGSINEEQVNRILAPAIKAKYPAISLKAVSQPQGGFAHAVAAGDVPDLVYSANTGLAGFFDLGIPENLSPMIAQFRVDMGRFDPLIVEDMKKAGNGSLYGLPISRNWGGTLYNKDLFDKFAVPYPGEAITWDEVVGYARRLTRLEDGVQYIGAAPFSGRNMLKQRGISNVDNKDEKAVFTTDGHLGVFKLLQQFYQIPGYVQGAKYDYSADFAALFTGRLGMLPAWIVQAVNNAPKYPTANWDLTAFPVFADRPNLGPALDYGMMLVNQTSKRKDAAYRVALLMTSDEIQLAMSRNGRFPVLKDTKAMEAFGEDSGVFKGKNLAAAVRLPSAPSPLLTKHAGVDKAIGEALQQIALPGTDVLTVLRQAEDKANLAIREEAAK